VACQAIRKRFLHPEKTKVVKKQSEISWDKAIDVLKVQFGKYIRQFAKVVEPQELINMISSDKDEVPKRLKFSHAAVMQSIRLNQHFETKPTSLEEMPLLSVNHW
jgi:phage replication initiation protein